MPNFLAPLCKIRVGPCTYYSFCCSLSAAILLLTCFLIGVGIFSLLLDFCPDHQLPNLLASLKRPALHRINPEFNHPEPWKDLIIPAEVDQALTELYEKILEEFVYSWYAFFIQCTVFKRVYALFQTLLSSSLNMY